MKLQITAKIIIEKDKYFITYSVHHQLFHPSFQVNQREISIDPSLQGHRMLQARTQDQEASGTPLEYQVE